MNNFFNLSYSQVQNNNIKKTVDKQYNFIKKIEKVVDILKSEVKNGMYNYKYSKITEYLYISMYFYLKD